MRSAKCILLFFCVDGSRRRFASILTSAMASERGRGDGRRSKSIAQQSTPSPRPAAEGTARDVAV